MGDVAGAVPTAEVLDAAPVGIFALGRDGSVLLWNREAERLTGWSAGQAGCRHRACTDAHSAIDRLLAGLCAGSYDGPLPGPVPSGRHLLVRAAPGEGQAAVVGVLQDVADDRAAEAFALFDALWQNAPLGLAYFGPDLRYRRVNAAAAQIGGAGEDLRVGRTLEEVHGETGARIAEVVRRVLAENRPSPDVRVVGRLWHGRAPERTLVIKSYPVHGRDGAVLGAGVLAFDVTEQERTREELDRVAAAREGLLRRYRSLIEATSAAVWIRAADGSAVEDSPSHRSITGQSPQDYAGWGFLDVVHPADREQVRAAWDVAARGDGDGVLEHSYRMRTLDGDYRWFRCRAVPVRGGEDGQGPVTEWVGTETDVDDEVRSRQRLAVLAGATHAVNRALDPETELMALAEAVVPEFADMCRVYLIDEPCPLAHGKPVHGRRSVTRVAAGLPPVPGGADFVLGSDHPLARSVRTREPALDVGPPDPATWPGTDEMLEWACEVRMNSRLVAPVLSGGEVVAAILFASCGERAPYTADDLALVRELAARASTAVEQGRRFQQTRQVSLALQDSMLTAPPTQAELGIGGIEVDARYLPAAVEMEVGGDWYDAFRLPFGDLAVAVGDVVGHDLAAAATMGQLRSMLRALAYDSDGSPSDVLRRLDRVASRLDVTGFTTLLHGRVLVRGGEYVFRWSNAGHPVPVLVTADGAARLIGGEVDVVLGVDPDRLRHDQEIVLPRGSTLLLYTDGLVERRDDPDIGLLSLLERAAASAALPLAEFCDAVVSGGVANTGDDVVVLALRSRARPGLVGA